MNNNIKSKSLKNLGNVRKKNISKNMKNNFLDIGEKIEKGKSNNPDIEDLNLDFLELDVSELKLKS